MHESVLKQEVLAYLNPKPGSVVLDATVGSGGHTEALAEKALLSRNAQDGLILGLDQDPEAIRTSRLRLARFGARVVLVESNFRNLDQVLSQYPQLQFDAILFDLGYSLDQVRAAGRGFSFMSDAPLDMRMSLKSPLLAADFINDTSEQELARIFWEFAEVHNSRRVARILVEERKKKRIQTTLELVHLLEKAGVRRRGKIHPATQIFQALRMAVNDELGACQEGIHKALDVLKPFGRLAVITFHSVEDRLVKYLFREEEKKGRIRLVNKKVIVPSRQEVLRNPRSRSAKLRVVEKL
ncbi:MAG: 16S rRNA (cytosine(1402)-N(4))-methyltransferase RsmH [Candidatus Omnitrophica bacterium]|nr:16S rRNA (cytosine(1402)-N(4))-methyltransferase RsmH [Candidatus Omnitrophota bacterium]